MMIINQSSSVHSIEWIFERDGSVRVYALAGSHCNPGDLVKVTYTPRGYGAYSFDTALGTFFVGSPTRTTIEGDWAWFFLAGRIEHVMLGETDNQTVVGVDGGNLSMSNKASLGPNDFGFILKTDMEDYSTVHLVPREIRHDA